MNEDTKQKAEENLAVLRRDLDIMREMRELIEQMISGKLKEIQQLRRDNPGL